MTAEKFRFCQQYSPQPLAAAMDTGLHRPHGGAGNGGDLLVVIAVEVGKDDRLALLEGEGEQGLLDAAAKGQPFHIVSLRLCGVGKVDRLVIVAGPREGFLGAAAHSPAQFILALVCRDAQEPATDTATLEAADGAVSGEECLLGSVLREAPIADQAEAQVVDGALISLNETVEGIEAAVL